MKKRLARGTASVRNLPWSHICCYCCAVKFSPANGVCTPSSTTCWYWDGYGWQFSPQLRKFGSPCSSWGSPVSVALALPHSGSCQDHPLLELAF